MYTVSVTNLTNSEESTSTVDNEKTVMSIMSNYIQKAAELNLEDKKYHGTRIYVDDLRADRFFICNIIYKRYDRIYQIDVSETGSCNPFDSSAYLHASDIASQVMDMVKEESK